MVITVWHVSQTNEATVGITIVCVCVFVSVSGHVDGAAEDYLRVYNALEKLVALTRSTIKDPEALSDLDELQQILGGSSSYDPATII